MAVYVGTSGFSYPEWKGNFYPEKLPAKKMLGFYAEHFRTVEANNTFRGLPATSVLDNWSSQVPAGFRFVLKAPQQITHIRRLAGAEDAVTAFQGFAENLGVRRGPLLFQLPPNFKKDVPRLRAFLTLLTPESRTAIEFRHPSWFDDEVFGALRDHGAALCLADAGDELAVPFVPTADWGYLRLRRPDYDDAALRAWADRVRSQNWRDCYAFFKHVDSGLGPRLAARLQDVLAGCPSEPGA
jgi:uncharacterized protein YecE (DUF72 family)